MPCLLLKDGVLVKTVKFKNPTYVGDPVNAIRIYNELEVDELVFLDITATAGGKKPPFKVLAEIADECFMPLAYGGGIRSLEEARTIFSLGFEKVVLNTAAFEQPELVRSIAETFGSQSIVVSVDARAKLLGGYEAYVRNGQVSTKMEVVRYAKRAVELGAGELLLYSIDRDGTHSGYDLSLIQRVTAAVSVPVVACGGAHSVEDFGRAVHQAGASACAAGSMVVHFGPHRAVLINFPDAQVIDRELTRH